MSKNHTRNGRRGKFTHPPSCRVGVFEECSSEKYHDEKSHDKPVITQDFDLHAVAAQTDCILRFTWTACSYEERMNTPT